MDDKRDILDLGKEIFVRLAQHYEPWGVSPDDLLRDASWAIHCAHCYYEKADQRGLLDEPEQDAPYVDVETALDDPEVSARTRHVLWRAGVTRWEDVRALTREGLLRIPNCGKMTAQRIISWAARYGVDIPDK